MKQAQVTFPKFTISLKVRAWEEKGSNSSRTVIPTPPRGNEWASWKVYAGTGPSFWVQGKKVVLLIPSLLLLSAAESEVQDWCMSVVKGMLPSVPLKVLPLALNTLVPWFWSLPAAAPEVLFPECLYEL